MKYRALGSTGLEVSVAGLGTGGHSRVGQRTGATDDESVALVRAAFDQGVSLIDTSEAYGTERVVGRAVADVRREAVVVSTKGWVTHDNHRRTAAELSSALEASLGRLGVDHVDIYHLHGVTPEDYEYARDVLLPVLAKHRERGTIRAVGITERFVGDTGHQMLQRAVADACWDVIMVGFNVLNQSATTRVLGPAREAGIGTLGMFAARRALSDPARLRDTLTTLVDTGHLPPEAVAADSVEWLLDGSTAQSLTELAYRFTVHEPGIDSVLFGTGNRRHLDENVMSLLAPPLPPAAGGAASTLVWRGRHRVRELVATRPPDGR